MTVCCMSLLKIKTSLGDWYSCLVVVNGSGMLGQLVGPSLTYKTHSRPRRTSWSKQAWSYGRQCVFRALADEEIISIDSTDSRALSEWSHLHKQRLTFFTKLIPAHERQPYWNAGHIWRSWRANEQLLWGCSPNQLMKDKYGAYMKVLES